MTMPEVEDFKALVDDEVILVAGDRRMPARIVEVKATTRHGGHTRQPFSVLFASPESEPMPQQIVAVEHASAETFELFLVPVGLGNDGEGIVYQAVFA